MSDLFENLPADAPIDEALVEEVTASLETMSKDIVSDKMKEYQLLQQSAAAGGPSSPQEAIWNLMDVCGVGIRALALGVGVGRRKLVRMLEGQISIPPETTTKMTDIFRKKRPDLFKDC